MDFDHREGEDKTAAVAQMVSSFRSKKSILAEIKSVTWCVRSATGSEHTREKPGSSKGRTVDFESTNVGSTPTSENNFRS